MKEFILYVLFIPLLFSCSDAPKHGKWTTTLENQKIILADFKDIKICADSLDFIPNEDFETKVSSDSLIILKRLYLGIENLNLSIEKSHSVKDLTIQKTVHIDYSQRTLNETPAFELGLDLVFDLKDNVLSTNFENVFERTENKHRKSILAKSRYYQTKLANYIIKTSDQPEYVLTANDYLALEKSKSNLLEQGLEPQIFKMTWEIVYFVKGERHLKIIQFDNATRQADLDYLKEIETINSGLE